MGLLHTGDDDTSNNNNNNNNNNGSVSNTKTLFKTCLQAGCIFSLGLLAGRGLDNNNNAATNNDDISSMMEDLPGYNGSGDEELLKPYDNDKLSMDVDYIMDETLDVAPIIDWEMIEEEENQAILQEEEEKPELYNPEFMEEEEMITVEEESLVPQAYDYASTDPEYSDGSEEEDDADDTPLIYERNLNIMEGHGHDMHMPLACNADLESQTCSSFASALAAATAGETLVVPCGECYEMDITDGSEVDLVNGLRIEGKLYFPSTASLTLKTKFIWVVGKLKMVTPDVDNKVTFKMYGDELQTFTANMETMHCGHGCNMGSKVIAVHGGQVDIQGYEEECPAWEKLTAVGEGEPRPFSNHLPSEGGTSWTTDVIELTGPCRHTQGHSEALGKYTVWCPIKDTGVHVGSGTQDGIKLTSIAKPSFEYPKDDNGQTLSLTIKSGCAMTGGHTDRFNRCVLYCPIEASQGHIAHGFDARLKFTSVAPTPARKYELPATTSLKIQNPCTKDAGRSSGWGRCVLHCKLEGTGSYGGSPWSKYQLTSNYYPPKQFPMPTNAAGTEATFRLASPAVYMAYHTSAWGGCVVRLPMEQTIDFGNQGYHSDAWLRNPLTGATINTKRFIHWAHGGRNMYLYLQDVSKDACEADGANHVNAIFNVGDLMDPAYRMVDDNGSADGSTFMIDRALHWAHGGENMWIFPTEKDLATCDDTAADFQAKFPAGYGIEVDYPPGPEGGDTFMVNKIHHWAWQGKYMFFFPAASDPATCSQTADGFNAIFASDYKIDVDYPADTPELGQELNASKGIHHWSWKEKTMYFHPDETAEEINAKFEPGFQLQVSYIDLKDHYEVEVSPTAASCWKASTEVLLTSHTRSMNDQQARTIESSDAATGIIRFSEPISRPISKADHPDFAVEIASLNRRIVFEAESDADDEFIGGHFVVHHTPMKQVIQGVEIKNFGQQGRLGKYPLHFHMCGDSPDSIVKKNVVRQSNQRCYVVHLTNKITLEENVAYDTFGHCYFIEDGAETDNVFRKNLGSGIKIMPSDRVALLEASSGRKESDGAPQGFNGASVFWISNPQNHFYGNVAAGGQKNGYWLETRGSRMGMKLGDFEDNEVHSSSAMAFSVYAPGWRPDEVSYIKNIKVYRNPSWGAFLHVTKNLYFQGGIFADNGQKAVMVNRGDDLVFDGTVFIGKTPQVHSHCSHEKTGISLSPVRLQETGLWNYNGKQTGLTMINTEFKDWSPEATECPGSIPLKFNIAQTFYKTMSAAHYFEGVKVDDNSSPILEACLSENGNVIDDVSVEIVNDPHNAFAGSSGFMVSPKVSTMVSSGCVSYNDCLDFCDGACLRTVSVNAGDAAFSEDIVLIVRDDINGNEITITRDVRGHPSPQPISNRFSDIYTVVLPKGKFTIKFERISDGSPAWPGYAFPVFEAAPSCSNHIVETDLIFTKPSAAGRSDCDELIYNGDFDSSTAWGVDGWNGFHHSVHHESASGVDGSGALATDSSNRSVPAQNIDSSCMALGDEYEVSVSYRIVNENYEEIELSASDNAPYARIQTQVFNTDDINNKHMKTLSHMVVAQQTTHAPGWNTFTGTFTVNDTLAMADALRFYIGGSSAYHLLIDNVSVTRITSRRMQRRGLRASAE